MKTDDLGLNWKDLDRQARIYMEFTMPEVKKERRSSRTRKAVRQYMALHGVKYTQALREVEAMWAEGRSHRLIGKDVNIPCGCILDFDHPEGELERRLSDVK